MGEDSKHPKERREIPTRKLPGKKPSGKMIKIVPRGYSAEKAQGETTTGPPPQQVEGPKGGFDDVVGGKHWIKAGEPAHPPPKPRPNLARNAIAAAVSFGITFVVVSVVIWINAPWIFGGGGGGGGGTGAYTWTISSGGQTATLTVDGAGNFTGTGWVGNAIGASPPTYNIYITNGRMSGTSMTFTVSGSYASGQGYISATCTNGVMNGTFPNATYASGTFSGTTKDPLTTTPTPITQSWTATKQ